MKKQVLRCDEDDIHSHHEPKPNHLGRGVNIPRHAMVVTWDILYKILTAPQVKAAVKDHRDEGDKPKEK